MIFGRDMCIQIRFLKFNQIKFVLSYFYRIMLMSLLSSYVAFIFNVHVLLHVYVTM